MTRHGSRQVVGHTRVLDAIEAAISSTEGTNIVILTGGSGSGKSHVLGWLQQRVGAPAYLDVRARAARAGVTLRSVRDLRSVSEAVGSLARGLGGEPFRVAAIDDIDSDVPPGLVLAFVYELIRSIGLPVVVLSMKTSPVRDVYPVPVREFSLERREASLAEVAHYVRAVLEEGGADRSAVGDELLSTLFLMQSQCPDFRAVEHVVRRLAARSRSRRGQLNDSDLYRLLRDDSGLETFRSFPGVSVAGGGRVRFRAKDKTEELCDMVLAYYDDPEELAAVAADGLARFDTQSFVAESAHSYRDAVMSLCLVRSPVELVSALFGPRDIIREIQRRGLDNVREFDSPGSRARLLVRGLGFTISPEPVGLSFYQRTVASARALAASDSTPAEALRGAGLGVTQAIELMLLDLAHFWATVLFGSIRSLVTAYNAETRGRPVQARRLTVGEIVALLRFLDRGRDEVRYSVGLLLAGRSRPLSAEFLGAAEAFVRSRNAFVHRGRSDSERRRDLVAVIEEILEHAHRVVATAVGPYPAVVKLVEVVFDEFGRRIYSAVDSDGRAVRFALTRLEEDGGVSISSHYFMTPAKAVTVDPVLVARNVTEAGVLFREADGYANSSATQRSQSSRLFDVVDLADCTHVLDVGSGDGKVSIDLAERFANIQVHGIDVSRTMVDVATATARVAGCDRVVFEEADILEFEPPLAYDAVVSNSVMHWVLPPEAGYRALFRCLRPGGTHAVHQGGHQTYSGMHSCALQVVEYLGLTSYFAGWAYPAYYPTRPQLEQLLVATGFTEIKVESFESDGSELVSLAHDFAFAGLLPYLRRVPEEKQELLRAEFLRHAERTRPSFYQHRLYATAIRP